MTGMEHAIEQAAAAIAERTGVDLDTSDGFVEEAAINPRALARALADAGLLAEPITGELSESAVQEWVMIPANQVREEWATVRPQNPESPFPTQWPNREIAENFAADEGRTVVHRWVSEWLPADDRGADL